MSWETVELQELCSPKQHKTIATKNLSESGYPVFGANGQIGFHSSYTHEEPTIAITCRGATCGTVNVTPEKCYINGNAMALDDLNKSKVDLNYLKYYFRNRGFHDVISGSAQPQITRAPLLTITLPLPPLPEQKRIAAILDQADTLRRQRQRALDHLNQLGQSIFYEMFGEHFLTFNNITTTFKDVSLKITDGTHHSPPIVEEGVPYITAKHLKKEGLIFEKKPWFVSEDEHQKIYKRCNPEYGDVLYIKDGATTGLAAINKYKFEFSMLSSLALIKPDKTKIDSIFMMHWLNADQFKARAIRNMSGAGITRLTLTKIKQFKIPIPDIEEQHSFRSKIQSLNKQNSIANESLKQSETLFAALQQRAFSGEL